MACDFKFEQFAFFCKLLIFATWKLKKLLECSLCREATWTYCIQNFRYCQDRDFQVWGAIVIHPHLKYSYLCQWFVELRCAESFLGERQCEIYRPSRWIFCRPISSFVSKTFCGLALAFLILWVQSQGVCLRDMLQMLFWLIMSV